ncbi:hypothetical protein [Epilithonimonas tenax]|uniref:hypothetical protein n=1 Tax=Epilithonimonas tenax TaxID=191577 RepID=UPI0012B666AC|nr:hypothetical protein [Epilithonimonas tenax]
MKILLLLFFSCSLSAQLYPKKAKGEVFNSKPTKPLENVNYSGLVVVKRSMYGLTFEDKNLSADVKNRIEKFFKKQYKGYTDFKIYSLNIYRKNSDWFIENHKI